MERDTQGCRRKDALPRTSAGEDQEDSDRSLVGRGSEMDAQATEGQGACVSPAANHLYDSGSDTRGVDEGGRDREAHHLPLQESQ